MPKKLLMNWTEEIFAAIVSALNFLGEKGVTGTETETVIETGTEKGTEIVTDMILEDIVILTQNVLIAMVMVTGHATARKNVTEENAIIAENSDINLENVLKEKLV